MIALSEYIIYIAVEPLYPFSFLLMFLFTPLDAKENEITKALKNCIVSLRITGLNGLYVSP